MKIELMTKKENRIMKRNELIFKVDHSKEKTPTLASLQQMLSKELGKTPEHIEIISVKSGKGFAISTASVFVWDEPKVANLAKEEKKEEAKSLS